MMSRPALASPSKNKLSKPSQANSCQSHASPIKYLLQNNVQLNAAVGQRGEEEVALIAQLVKECRIFKELQLGENVVEDVSRGAVLIFCESPHIMPLKENELYIVLEGQGFEYMQNECNNQLSRKYKVYENEEYIMVRKILTNQYFLTQHDNTARYHSRNKYQFMVDQSTLLAKVSDDLFHKLFLPKVLERQKKLSLFLKSVAIFNGLPNSFFFEFSKFLEDLATQPEQRIIARGHKSKYVYFVRKGLLQIHRFTDKCRPAGGSSQYVISSKGFTSQQFAEGDTFGMEDELGEGVDEEVISVTQCQLLRIEKRLLAIIITSFDFEFQQRSKIWSEVNINSQIKGQNHSSPEQQLLARNAERIRTAEKKARDLKLRFFAGKKASVEQQGTERLSREDSRKQVEDMQTSKTLSPEKRRMIKTTDGRFRATNKLSNRGTISEVKMEVFQNQMISSKRLSHQGPLVNNYEILVMQTEEAKTSPLLRSSNAFEYIEQLQSYRWGRPVSLSCEKGCNSQKFIPKMQMRNKDAKQLVESRYDSDLIGLFLDKKIKNQMVRKAEKVMNLNRNLKSIENKNLKRLFTGTKEGRTINAISDADKKNIANDIVDRMSNLRDNPLLLQVENERRKIERQLKLTEKKNKASVGESPKKTKKEEDCIYIRNK